MQYFIDDCELHLVFYYGVFFSVHICKQHLQRKHGRVQKKQNLRIRKRKNAVLNFINKFFYKKRQNNGCYLQRRKQAGNTGQRKRILFADG